MGKIRAFVKNNTVEIACGAALYASFLAGMFVGGNVMLHSIMEAIKEDVKEAEEKA